MPTTSDAKHEDTSMNEDTAHEDSVYEAAYISSDDAVYIFSAVPGDSPGFPASAEVVNDPSAVVEVDPGASASAEASSDAPALTISCSLAAPEAASFSSAMPEDLPRVPASAKAARSNSSTIDEDVPMGKLLLLHRSHSTIRAQVLGGS